MNYSVNPKELNSIFALPSCVVEDHIKLASEYQLKALLLFVKNQNDTEVFSLICKKLNLSENEAKECLDYWVQRGVLLSDDNSVVKQQNSKSPVVVDSITEKPTRQEAVKRIDNSEELKYLTAVAQEKFARPITTAEMRTFVWLYDTYGLPVPVIILAIQYAYDSDRLRFSYVEKVCVDWAKNDITTLSKAEERLNALYLSKTAWKLVESAFGIEHRKPTSTEKKYVDKWVNEFEFNKDMLECAYDVCINKISKINFEYINSILEDWHKQGYKKPKDIKTQEDNKKSKKDNGSSFDISDIMKKVNNFD